MTFDQIAAEFTWNCQAFINAVQTHCGFDISDEEIDRIASTATTPVEFDKIWANEDWWTDENNT